MMRKYRFLWLLLLTCWGYVGCEENEIALYDEAPRLNMLWRVRDCYFRDTNYVKGDQYLDVRIEVGLQGYLIDQERTFVVKALPMKNYDKQAEVVLDAKYTYTALDTVRQWMIFKVKRPTELTNSREPYRAVLRFDDKHPDHQFGEARVDKDSCQIDVYFDITPTGAEWNPYAWGEYSTGKYFFMMDYFRQAYKDMDETRLEELKQAYTEYKATHGDILDDDGNPITFPN